VTKVTWTTVTYPDGLREPQVVVDYRVGDYIVAVVELKDPNPSAPYEVPGAPRLAVQTIDGSQYLFGSDSEGRVVYVQFKTVDGIVFSVNFYGPPYPPDTTGPGGADRQFATDIVRHLE